MNIIVTGASQGVGREIVKSFARSKHHHVIAIARQGKLLEELARDCKLINPDSKITPYEFDLTQFDYYSLIIQRFQNFMPHCDVLINNAGKMLHKSFLKIDNTDFDDIFNVNVKSLFFFTQALIPMIRKGGHIVNISSMGAIPGSKKFRGLSAYSASKGAVAILSEILAEELQSMEISVNCLALGSVDTDMFEKAFPGMKAATTPEQMAQFITDFALNGHKYFNGKVLPVALTTP